MSQQRAVSARAWCRVDLAGGTLDIWPVGVLHPGAVTVNLAVDVAARVRVAPAPRYRVRQDDGVTETATAVELAAAPEGALVGTALEVLAAPPLEVALASDSPRGGGLGASSALAVALIAAVEELLERPPSPPERRVALARDLEARLMGLPTGVQDHWPALLGGALAIHHDAGGTEVRRLDADLDALAASLLVVYSGVSHFSAGQNWQVLRRRLDGDRDTVELFASIAEVAARAEEALTAGDLERLGRLVAEEWSLRRRLAAGVSVPAVEELLQAARDAGAWGGKACGAGGGGCLAVLTPPGKRQAVSHRLTTAGGTLVPARPAAEPLRVAVE